MLHLLHRLLGMNHRELRRSLPLFAYLFLTMAGSVASKAARDALFLERFRAADLPYVDIAIACMVGVVASLYIRAGERLNLRNLQVGSLLAFARLGARFLVVVHASREARARRCSSSSTSGWACCRCWRRPRSGRWPTSS